MLHSCLLVSTLAWISLSSLHSESTPPPVVTHRKYFVQFSKVWEDGVRPGGEQALLNITHCAEVLAPFPSPPTQCFGPVVKAIVWTTLLGHRQQLCD